MPPAAFGNLPEHYRSFIFEPNGSRQVKVPGKLPGIKAQWPKVEIKGNERVQE